MRACVTLLLLLSACCVALATSSSVLLPSHSFHALTSPDIVVTPRAVHAGVVWLADAAGVLRSLHDALDEQQVSVLLSQLLSVAPAAGDVLPASSVQLHRVPRAVLVYALPGVTREQLAALAGDDDVLSAITARATLMPSVRPVRSSAVLAGVSSGLSAAHHKLASRGARFDADASLGARLVNAHDGVCVPGVTAFSACSHMAQLFAKADDADDTDRDDGEHGARATVSVLALAKDAVEYRSVLRVENADAHSHASQATPMALAPLADVLRSGAFETATGIRVAADLASVVIGGQTVLLAENKAVRGLVYELAGALGAAQLAAVQRPAEASCPQFVSLTPVWVKRVVREQPELAGAALHAALGVFRAAHDVLSAAFGRRVTSVLVATGAQPRALLDGVRERVEAAVSAHLPDAVVALPDVHARDAPDAKVRSACGAVRKAMANEPVDVYCPHVEGVESAGVSPFVLSARLVGADNTTNNNTVNYSWQFNIFFWFPLLIVVVLIIIVVTFSTAENKRDSLVYRTSRPKHD